jgi:hypothetical protein
MRFARAFAVGQGRETIAAPEMDAILHAERQASAPHAPRPSVVDLAALPDGAMLAADDRAFAIRAGRILPWSFEGYGPALPSKAATIPTALRLLTPPATVAALAAGYAPVWHATAYPAVASASRP